MKILLACLLCLCIIPFNLTYSEARSSTPTEKAIPILNQLLGKNDTDLPISGFGFEKNDVLFIEIDDRFAKQPLDVYKQRLVNLLGYIPMDVKFGHFDPDMLLHSPIPRDFSLNFFTQSRPLLENSTIKDLHLRFLHASTNTTVYNVSFFINATKGDKILMYDMFFTPSGFLTIHLQPKNSEGNWTVIADHDPVLGVWMSKTGEISLIAPIFTEEGLYHFEAKILTIDYANTIVDQKNPTKFDSWWFMDTTGNVSELDISKPFWMKNNYLLWNSGAISDQEFTNEIQYLMDENMIKHDSQR